MWSIKTTITRKQWMKQAQKQGFYAIDDDGKIIFTSGEYREMATFTDKDYESKIYKITCKNGGTYTQVSINILIFLDERGAIKRLEWIKSHCPGFGSSYSVFMDYLRDYIKDDYDGISEMIPELYVNERDI